MRNSLAVLALGSSLMAGCATPAAPQEAVPTRPVILEAEMSYVAACRACLHALQAQYGEVAVWHEFWPDTQQASLHVSRIGPLRLLVTVMIEGTGPGKCRVEVCGAEYWHHERAVTLVRRALGIAPPAGAQR